MDQTITAILGAVFGALITGPITFFYTKRAVATQEFVNASASFRNSFANEQTMLEVATLEVFQILNRDAFLKHQTAKIIFEPFLSGKRLVSFQADWQTYEDYYKKRTQKISPGSVTVRKNETQKASDIIRKLVSHAAPPK